jgi:hypothetical protein
MTQNLVWRTLLRRLMAKSCRSSVISGASKKKTLDSFFQHHKEQVRPKNHLTLLSLRQCHQIDWHKSGGHVVAMDRSQVLSIAGAVFQSKILTPSSFIFLNSV